MEETTWIHGKQEKALSINGKSRSEWLQTEQEMVFGVYERLREKFEGEVEGEEQSILAALRRLEEKRNPGKILERNGP